MNKACEKGSCWLSDRWWGHEGRWCVLEAACWLNTRPQEPVGFWLNGVEGT